MAANDYDPYGGNGDYGNVDPNTGNPTPTPTTPPGPTNPGATGGNTSGLALNEDGSQPIDPTTGLPYPRRERHDGAGYMGVNDQITPDPTPTPTPAPTPYNPGGGGSSGPFYPGTQLQQDPRWDTLVNTLMGRAQQSLNIDPLTDPIIRPQVDNYGAMQTRNANRAIDAQAEAGNPYATGSLQNTRNQMNEQAGFNTSNLQSSLMTNELTARRKDITDAMQESGQLLTADQNQKLQEELGLIDANLKQQGINSGNDQFAATLGLNTTNMNNYWDAIRSGLIK